MVHSPNTSLTLPQRVGVGLKAQHYPLILETQPDVAFFEIHPENYMCEGGPAHRYLESIRKLYPLSMHGVGLSLGSGDGLNQDHLQRLKLLCERYQPNQVSEHLAWSQIAGVHLNDLLPLPYTHESLNLVMRNINDMQETLARTILIENPSTYISFKNNDYSEPEFLNTLAQRTGCGLLLDINNVFVSGTNNGFDPYGYIDAVDASKVQEIHLAGHSEITLKDGMTLRIDDHGSPIKPSVWQLYQYFLTRNQRAVATLIEWDTDVPEFDVLLSQATIAKQHLQSLTSL